VEDFITGIGMGLANQPESDMSKEPMTAEALANALGVAGFAAGGVRDSKYSSTFILQQSLATDATRVIIMTHPHWLEGEYYASFPGQLTLTPATPYPWGEIRSR
jgi:hypothetical protein